MPSAKQPPHYPSDLSEIAEAIELCGHVARRGTLSLDQYKRERLVRYCGRMPASRDEAERWKLWLRQLRRDANAEQDPEEVPP